MLVKDAVKKLLEMDQEALLLRADNSGGYEKVYDAHYEPLIINNFAKNDSEKEVKAVILE